MIAAGLPRVSTAAPHPSPPPLSLRPSPPPDTLVGLGLRRLLQAAAAMEQLASQLSLLGEHFAQPCMDEAAAQELLAQTHQVAKPLRESYAAGLSSTHKTALIG